MLDPATREQLAGYLARIQAPILLAASCDGEEKSQELLSLLQEIAALSDKITLVERKGLRVPSFRIERVGTDIGVEFAGIPLGHEFSSLVLALLQVSGHPIKQDEALITEVRDLEGQFKFETYFSLSCQNCPDVVQALNMMSIINPHIQHTAIDGALFPDEIEKRQVMAVPSVFLNGEIFAQGRLSFEELVAKLNPMSTKKAAAILSAKKRFDVLVVGGGPAGVAAAVYAARKGISTGIVAEKLGGQVQDTLAIENLITVAHTEGPLLARSFEEVVKSYGVDVMSAQQVTSLLPAQAAGGDFQLQLANGATLTARTVILAPGARWRHMNVPGEEAYKNKGVAFCPHCDGPLFKGKKLAVIGGGNSGVEAAIDLAGLAAEVTLLEFDHHLRADAVLQEKLKTIPHARVITSAHTVEVHGDQQKVEGLSYQCRKTDQQIRLDLDGVFVQIGLIPNTEWLRDRIALTPRGEIEIDGKGQTSLPGVYAAGDATTVAYKQIIIALGAGATAALSAFDYLIRQKQSIDS